MKLKANYHTHLKLCGHAVGMTKDYVQEAIKDGYEELGISDHGYIPKSFMSEQEYLDNWLHKQMTEEDFNKVYIPDVLSQRKQNENKIKILLGLEVEYIPGHDDYYSAIFEKLDYINLGIHYFKFDDQIVNVYETMTPKLLEGYKNTAIEAMETGYFTTLVHPDLFMYSYSSPNGYLVFDEYCEKASRAIIESSIKNHVNIELNCGGIMKGLKKMNGKFEYSYPRTEFWNIVRDYPEASVVIGVDAHKPSALNDSCIDIAKQMLETLGINYQEKIEPKKK